MNAQKGARKSHFNRNLLLILVALYLLTLSALAYAIWSSENRPGREMLLNIPILSLPLFLLFGSFYVLAVAWREHSTLGQINPRLAQIIHWAPRIASILIIFFVSLFSLDVFETPAPPLELLGGFLIHNLPAILMIVLLIFAWKRPLVGFVAFLAVGALLALLLVRNIYALSNVALFVIPIVMFVSTILDRLF